MGIKSKEEEGMDNNQMNNQMNNQQYSQPYVQAQPQYINVNVSPDLEKPMSIGDWIIFYLVMCVPVVNIVMLFVWAFGGGNRSRANYCKASLIIAVVATVLSILVAIIVPILFGAGTLGLAAMLESLY